jgi:hypothetical protein
MAYLASNVLDKSLEYIQANVNRLDICSTEPTTYTEATSTYSLGNKTSPTISAPEAGSPNGRQVEVSAITDGTVTGTGTAAYWALTKTGTSELIAVGQLSASQAVTAGNTFTLTAFTIRFPAVS